jgi:hypothetical protein
MNGKQGFSLRSAAAVISISVVAIVVFKKKEEGKEDRDS